MTKARQPESWLRRLLSAVTGAFLFLAAPASYAFTYVMMHDEALLKQSEVVVRGRILAAERTDPAGSATAYRLVVEEAYKGRPASTIEVVVPGVRRPEAAGLWISGAPHFSDSEELLLFLAPDGTDYRIVQFALGAFRIVEIDGREYAMRNLTGGQMMQGNGVYTAPDQTRDMREFTKWLRDQSGNGAGSSGSQDYRVDDPAITDEVSEAVTEKFTLFSDGTNNFRWPDYDNGTGIGWGRNGGATFATQVADALDAWVDDPWSKILLTLNGTTSASAGFMFADGENTVLFGDPNDEIPGSFDCPTGGTLAIGGIWGGGTHASRGKVFRTIVEGDVITQNGAECFFNFNGKADGEEVIGHEIGHAQGLRHSCGDGPSGPCDNDPPGDDAALMRAFAHGDGRGASLGQDDRQATVFLYPDPGDDDGLPVVSVHGAACQPANLNQSVNLNTSWSQRGVRNVNALGSGLSFFVACPVSVTDNGAAVGDPDNPDIWVHVGYDDRDQTNRVTCTAFRASEDTGNFIKTVSGSADNPGTGPDAALLELPDITDPGNQAFELSSESYTVICALVPQSGIQGIVFDFD